jgi:DNA polymerase epsilon subunit 3
MPKDVFDAMHELEFDFMLPRLEAEVTKFTSIQADKRNTYRKKVREEKKAAKEPLGGGMDGDEPAAKRARMDGEGGQSDDDGEEGDETIDVDDEEVEDDEIEEDDGEGQEGEGLTEDPLEEREDKDEDDEMGDGDESD